MVQYNFKKLPCTMKSDYDKLAVSGGWSNGRTPDSESVCRGSNPLPPA